MQTIKSVGKHKVCTRTKSTCICRRKTKTIRQFAPAGLPRHPFRCEAYTFCTYFDTTGKGLFNMCKFSLQSDRAKTCPTGCYSHAIPLYANICIWGQGFHGNWFYQTTCSYTMGRFACVCIPSMCVLSWGALPCCCEVITIVLNCFPASGLINLHFVYISSPCEYVKLYMYLGHSVPWNM